MSEESDYRDVLARAAEAGAFDDCWLGHAPLNLAGGLFSWRERCYARALEIATPPAGIELSTHVEGTILPGGAFRPRFLLIPTGGAPRNKTLDAGSGSRYNEDTGQAPAKTKEET